MQLKLETHKRHPNYISSYQNVFLFILLFVVQGKCSSDVLLKEPSSVVQLQYDHKALLVSTKQRSLVCRLDGENKTFQVGQKERKM